MDEPRANMDSQDSPWLELWESHHLPPYTILCAWPRDQHPNVIMSRDSQVGVPKFPQLGFLQLWGPIILRVDLWWKWGLKQSCSSRQELFNGMSRTTCMQGNQGDSWLLMVESQIANLIPSPSFGYNLCAKCPNGSCEPILEIYILRAFQWYKELFNPMGFDPCNYSLNIQKSTETPTPKVGTHLGMWRFSPSHSLALPGAWNVTPGLHTWPAPSQAFILVTSLRLGLRPKMP
jgi:hypothetical protein